MSSPLTGHSTFKGSGKVSERQCFIKQISRAPHSWITARKGRGGALSWSALGQSPGLGLPDGDWAGRDRSIKEDKGSNQCYLPRPCLARH